MDSRLRGNDENESRRFVRNTIKCDFAIVGGGLAGGLIALALKHHRPELDVRLIVVCTKNVLAALGDG